MSAFIVRRNDAALMERHRDTDAANRDMSTRDPRHQHLTVVTSETHRVITIDGYTYVAPRAWTPSKPPAIPHTEGVEL
jgi:hypothetical protein